MWSRPHSIANAGYDGLRDFTHIAYLGGPPVVLIVHPSLGVKTYKEFLEVARASKEPMSYISPGTGSHGFVVGEYLARQEGFKLSHIPYKGAGPALTDLVAGHVKLGFMTFSSAAEQVRAGKVLALAISTEKRMPALPDVPTFREVGRDLVAATWFSLSGPAKLPNDIVQQVSRETLKAMQLPDVQKRLAQDAIEVAALDAGAVHQIHRGRDRTLGAARQGACQRAEGEEVAARRSRGVNDARPRSGRSSAIPPLGEPDAARRC